MEKPLPLVNSEMLTYMHVCHHSPSLRLSYAAPQMERRQQRELCGLHLNGVCRLLSR